MRVLLVSIKNHGGLKTHIEHLKRALTNIDFHTVEFSYKKPLTKQEIVKLIDRFKPDVIHFHHIGGIGTILNTAKKFGIKTVATIHGNIYQLPNPNIVRKLLVEIDHIIVLCNRAIELNGLKHLKSKISVIPNPINPNKQVNHPASKMRGFGWVYTL